VNQARLAPSRAEWASFAFAVIVAHAFLVHEWFYPSAWDATQYVEVARDIADRGMFRPFTGSAVRTYGYPLVLSLVLRVADATGLSFVALLFAFQFLAYVVAAFFLRRALALESPAAARIAFCGLLVNFYVLIYASQSLSESLSLTLLVFAAAAWVALWNKGLASIMLPLVAGSLVVGFGLMVRPANMFMVASWVFGVAVVWLRHRPPARRAVFVAAITLVAIALPMTPQIYNNAVQFGKASPLVNSDIGFLQQTVGVQNLKYATAMPPVPHPRVFYDNPMYPGTTISETSPWTWYFKYPLRGAATLALHTFNLTDQDLLFTYSRDLDPWYRVPLGIVNHAVMALGLVGLLLLGQHVRISGELRWRDAYIVLLALLGSNWAVYAWTAVEMRFGSVLLLVFFPLAGYAAMRLAVVNSFSVRGGVLFGIAAYVLVAMLLSGWVRDQSQQIREFRAARAKSVGLRGAGDACCAPATDSATREAAFDPPHSHGSRFAG
jgi:hypothetical protein